jgi:hypothetical protein
MLAALALAVSMLVSVVGLASAHEHRDVGPYALTVGFRNEPAIADEPNGLDLRVTQGDPDEPDAKPVEGLEKTLKAEVLFGGQRMPLTLRAVYGKPGAYTADFIPTQPGDYTFHIFGTINGTTVDERFTSSPTTFSPVRDRSTLTFPAAAEPPLAAVHDMTMQAQHTAEQARLLGIAGLVVGVLGLMAGLSGLLAARRAQAMRPAPRVAPGQSGD